MPKGEIILYATEDGKASIELKAEEGTVWLTQLEIAELFQSTKQNISLHIKNILEEGELTESVVKEDLTTAADGKRYRTKMYNLNMILAIGYRVVSHRGTQFRRWATVHLQEYLVKGFVMNDARLKEPKPWDYFDEWLERIREIRASEKRFYQKVRDIYATAVDYDPKSDQAKLFFKKVQNKMLWAVTNHTASELIVERADSKQPNMGLKSWKGSRVWQQDVIVAKNYLEQPEIEELNQIVVMYLDYAENQAKHRKTVTMAEWEQKLDAFLTFNEKDLLDHADDFIVTAASKEVLECKVKPVIIDFMKGRGLKLSFEKTKITHIDEGFDFLGFNARKYGGKLLIKPAKKEIKSFLDDIRRTVETMRAVKTEDLIKYLNVKIQGWVNYYKHCVAKATFNYIDNSIFWILWKWAKRRHPNRGTSWIRKRYYTNSGLRKWCFYSKMRAGKEKSHILLTLAQHTKIRRYVKVRAEASPYDPDFKEYFIKREREKMRNRIAG